MSYELIFGKPELLVEILLEIAKQYNKKLCNKI